MEVVRRWEEAFNRREVPLEFLHPEVEWIEDPRYPGAQTYRGREGVERSINGWWETWAWQTMRVEGMVDADDLVIHWGTTEARGTDSEVTVSTSFGVAWEFRDGLIVRVHVLAGRDEALKAVGLRE